MLVGGRKGKNICDLNAVDNSDLRIYIVKSFVSVFLCPLYAVVLMQTCKTLYFSCAHAHSYHTKHDGNTQGIVNNGNPKVQG